MPVKLPEKTLKNLAVPVFPATGSGLNFWWSSFPLEDAELVKSWSLSGMSI